MLESDSLLVAKLEDLELWSPDFMSGVLTHFAEGLILWIPLWMLASSQVRNEVPSYVSGHCPGAIESQSHWDSGEPPGHQFVCHLVFKEMTGTNCIS